MEERDEFISQLDAQRKLLKKQRKLNKQFVFTPLQFIERIISYNGASDSQLVQSCMDSTYGDVVIPKFLEALMRTIAQQDPTCQSYTDPRTLRVIQSLCLSVTQLQQKYFPVFLQEKQPVLSTKEKEQQCFQKIREVQIQVVLHLLYVTFQGGFADPLRKKQFNYFVDALRLIPHYFDAADADRPTAGWNLTTQVPNTFRSFLKRTLCTFDPFLTKLPQTLCNIFRELGYTPASLLLPKNEKSDAIDIDDISPITPAGIIFDKSSAANFIITTPSRPTPATIEQKARTALTPVKIAQVNHFTKMMVSPHKHYHYRTITIDRKKAQEAPKKSATPVLGKRKREDSSDESFDSCEEEVKPSVPVQTPKQETRPGGFVRALKRIRIIK